MQKKSIEKVRPQKLLSPGAPFKSTPRRKPTNAQGSKQASAISENKPWEFDEQYRLLCEQYVESGQPITVNFRELVPVAAGADRATHLIHPYPAKLLVNIPLFFANCSQLSKQGDTILDPFCGTGTVLLEAVLAGRRAVGADSNPLARLISKVKLNPLDTTQVKRSIYAVLERSKSIRPAEFSAVVDVDRWYSRKTATALGKLLAAIDASRNEPVREFLKVAFSSCVKRVSYADPRLSVPVRLKPDKAPDALSAPEVRAVFERIALANLGRLSAFKQMLANVAEPSPACIDDDARHLNQTSGDLASLVITSPPYTSAQKYIRASTLSLGWLGLAPDDLLRNLERLNIGREHFSKQDYKSPPSTCLFSAQPAIDRIWKVNPLRAHIASTYLDEMHAALKSACARLKPNGHFVLVIGDNTVCRETFSTSAYLSEILTSFGLTKQLELVDHIRSRGLMTKRNKTAGMIGQEHIHVFRKSVGEP